LVSILRPGSYLIASIHTALNDSELMRFQRDLIDQVGRHRARGVIIDVAAVDVLESSGIKMISLADTVGLALPEQVHALVSAVTDRFGYLEIGVHLHSRPNQARDKILAAYDAGCRRFDSALGGLGGCPFAQDMLVGNIPTEILLAALGERGAELPPLKSLDALVRATTEIGARYTSSHAAD